MARSLGNGGISLKSTVFFQEGFQTWRVAITVERSTDEDNISRTSGQAEATRKRRRAPSPCPDVSKRPKKRQKARAVSNPDVIELFSSPTPPPRPARSKGQAGTREVISLVSDSENDDPPSCSSKPANQSFTCSDLSISLRDFNGTSSPFTHEDEDVVAEQLAPSSPSTTVSTPVHPLAPHATPSAVEECLRDGLSTITSVIHLLPPHLVSSLKPSPGSAPRVEIPTPTVDTSGPNPPQDSSSEPPRPRPRSLKRPSIPSDTPDPSDLRKEPPVPLTTGNPPNPNPPHTPFKSPIVDKPPSPSTRKRCRSNNLAPTPTSTSVRWVRQTAVEYMGCHHSLWSPRLVREEVPSGAPDSQQDVEEGGMAVEKDNDSEKSVRAEEEDDQIDELISSDTEGMGNNANDTTQGSPPLPADNNHDILPSRPPSPTKPRRHQSSFSPNLFARVLNLNLQRSSISSTPPSLPSLLPSSSPSASSASTSSASPKPLSLLDKLPSLVKPTDIPASPFSNSMQSYWAMDIDPMDVDGIEDADFENMVLAYPS
ncbi:hypothetical protein EYR36_003937 [Pleurotus pulmonarius]|nr:hypothetical protein EYR36_003937 [Pleurotus pulmonarius]